MPKLREDDAAEPLMKNNVLPFPALYAAPRDPPKPSLLRGFVTLVVLGLALGLTMLTLWTLF